MLKDKIQKLIDLIENTQIEEIEVSSFWGAPAPKAVAKRHINRVTAKNTPLLRIPPLLGHVG